MKSSSVLQPIRDVNARRSQHSSSASISSATTVKATNRDVMSTKVPKVAKVSKVNSFTSFWLKLPFGVSFVTRILASMEAAFSPLGLCLCWHYLLNLTIRNFQTLNHFLLVGFLANSVIFLASKQMMHLATTVLTGA